MPRNRETETPKKTLAEIRDELRAVWEAWAASIAKTERWIAGALVIGAPEGWLVGCAYIRESHKESMQGFSPTGQLREILDDAAKRNLWIPWENVFLDNLTGRHDQRPEFLGLMELARSGKIQEVMLMHSSRFARNVEIAKRYKNELRRRGIAIRQLNLRQVDIATPEGKLIGEHPGGVRPVPVRLDRALGRDGPAREVRARTAPRPAPGDLLPRPRRADPAAPRARPHRSRGRTSLHHGSPRIRRPREVVRR